MTIKKIVPIDYTSRDFSSIKSDLVEYAKRYYPDIYKDFNQASFGSLMLDTVSYIGDILSFYLDYQANESFIETSIEYSNVLNHAKQMGYKHKLPPSAHGILDFYIKIPVSQISNEPDTSYVPRLLKGSTFSTTSGKVFTLNENVSFNPSGPSMVTVESEGAEGPLFYLVRSSGQVVSGQRRVEEIEVGDFRRFLRLEMEESNVAEIISVTDTQGNKYYEVEYLSQDVVYREIPNKGINENEAPSLLKPFPVPRRYVVEYEDNKVFLQFGYGSESELKNKSIVDPSEVVLKVHGKDYVTDSSFDPSRLTSTDKFGVVPSNTILTVTYRSNTNVDTNAAISEVNSIQRAFLFFEDEENLDAGKVSQVRNSIEVDNPEAIVGNISLPTTDELKRRAIDVFATQNRAVTKRDYVSSVYNMPTKFGAIKRCSAERDSDELRRVLNLYVLSEDSSGLLTRTNSTVKNNLKTWLNSIRMMNDSIQILDGRIVNIGIEYDIIIESDANEVDVLARCNQELIDDLFIRKMDLGQPFYITDIFKSLKDVEGMLDVVDIRIVNKTTQGYSPVQYSIVSNTSPDGRYVGIPFDHVFEVKYPTSDLVGRVV